MRFINIKIGYDKTMKYTRFISEYPEALDWKLSGGVAIIVDCSSDTTIVEIPDIIEGTSCN